MLIQMAFLFQKQSCQSSKFSFGRMYWLVLQSTSLFKGSCSILWLTFFGPMLYCQVAWWCSRLSVSTQITFVFLLLYSCCNLHDKLMPYYILLYLIVLPLYDAIADTTSAAPWIGLLLLLYCNLQAFERQSRQECRSVCRKFFQQK